MIRIILIAKTFSWTYSPKNWELRNICQLATVARLYYYVISVSHYSFSRKAAGLQEVFEVVPDASIPKFDTLLIPTISYQRNSPYSKLWCMNAVKTKITKGKKTALMSFKINFSRWTKRRMERTLSIMRVVSPWSKGQLAGESSPLAAITHFSLLKDGLAWHRFA